MRRITLYIVTSIFTFVIGVALTTFCLVRQYFHVSASDSVDRTINCSSIFPAGDTRIESKILKESDSRWRYDEITTSGKENLYVIQFINANEGWVGGANGALYKTTSAGKGWQKVPLDVPPDSVIDSISFADSSTGWLVAYVEGNEFRDVNTVKSWVLNTTDGGKTWRTQYQESALRIDRVQFVDEKEGWAVGSKYSEKDFIKGFIIRTTDGGRRWTNLSADAAKNEIGNLGIVGNIQVQAPSKATILKFSRTFYSTSDGGQTWAKVGSLPDEPAQAFLDRFDLIGGNRMWAVGGADSIEGMWGTLARMDSNCSWKKYSIGGACFWDATFVSENEVLVCGTMRSESNTKGPRGQRDGLIMSSIDGGANWKIVYRSSGKVFEAMAQVTSQNIWAVSAGGVIVHLQPK